MTYTHEDFLRDRSEAMAMYHGDVEKYNAAHKKVVGAGIMWSDIEAYANIYPEHGQHAQDEIIRLLGYLPHSNVIIPHEVFIRTLIDQRNKGTIMAADYERDLTRHAIHIRNDDMDKFGWADKIRYTWEELEHYNNYLPQYEAIVHSKIQQYFGSMPALDCIIPADMMLRKVMSQHPDIITDRFTPMDYKAFNIIAYRKAVTGQGKKSADQLELLPL